MAGPVVTDCSVAMSQEAADRAQRAVHDSPSAESSHDIEVAASGGRGGWEELGGGADCQEY